METITSNIITLLTSVTGLVIASLAIFLLRSRYKRIKLEAELKSRELEAKLKQRELEIAAELELRQQELERQLLASRLEREQLEHRLEQQQLEQRQLIESLRSKPMMTGGTGKKAEGVEPRSVVPPVPEELVEACASGACILMAGTGVSAQAGYPTWNMALESFIKLASKKQPGDDGYELLAELQAGNRSSVEGVINSRLMRDELAAAALELYGGSVSEQPAINEYLSGLNFAGVVTPNWDSLMERAFEERKPLIVLSSQSEQVEKLIAGEQFFIIKLYGDPREPESFRFSPEEYNLDLFENQNYLRFLTSLFLTKTVFFLGVSLRGIEDYLSGLNLRNRPSKPHFALVPLESNWAIQEELFLNKYGVRLLGYGPTSGHPEVPTFVERLRDAVAEREPDAAVEIQEATLSHVRLRNIGVFEDLNLSLNQGWNVFLGSNGCGKSTILRAIALGLCGEDAKAAGAGRWLLRSGTQNGSIELRVGEVSYLTELIREGEDTVRVVCRQLTPLQKGNWVVLGFPSLRGVSTRNPVGPAGKSVRRPVVQDLLPLIQGALDPRMDDLKQWLVNVHTLSTPRDDVSPAEALRNSELRDSLFSLVKEVSPERLQIEFDHVDSQTWQVVVNVDGVPVSLDQISQGMSSTFGWIGTMLQRMYEIHHQADHPEQEAALILVDEIDAHLHPEWQQILVPLFKKRFKRLQMITTTHSPLVVAGMSAKEVWIARRSFNPDDRNRVEVLEAPIDFEGMRADQILTSPAFGLLTSRSLDTKRDIDRFAELLGKAPEELDEDERRDLKELETKLENVIQIGETETQRKVENAVRRAFNELSSPRELFGVQELSPEERLEIKRQLAEVFAVDDGDEEESEP